MSGPRWSPNQVRVIDVSNAYLQSKMTNKNPVYLLPPVGHEDRGRYVWLIHRYV